MRIPFLPSWVVPMLTIPMLCTGCLLLTTSPDSDGDGVTDINDNCPDIANPDQIDMYEDAAGEGDACGDIDNDTVTDIDDNCPLAGNADQGDLDGDELGDACDSDGLFSVSWSLHAGADDRPATCPGGDAFMELTMTAGDGTVVTEEHPCGAGRATTGSVGFGDYRMELALRRGDGVLQARSDAVDVTMSAVEIVAVPPLAFSIDHGRYTIEWALQENGSAVSCAAVGATAIVVRSQPVGGGLAIEGAQMPCSGETGGSVTTGPLPVDGYRALVTLIGNGVVITDSEVVNVAIEYGNHIADAGSVVIDVTAVLPPAP